MSTQTQKRVYRKRARAEAEEETRLRITEAIMHLHEEVGPAQTTVSGIAERAGVQRATVYRYFPDVEAQVAACSAHWLSLNPPPDPTAWMEIPDPDERLRGALTDLYRWYEGTESTVTKLYRDAPLVSPIQARMEERGAAMGYMAEQLLQGRGLRGARKSRVLAAINHALAFGTWMSLVREQDLSRDQAVDLMARMVAAA
jgi:AcrR family transcriptional regulator